MKYASLFTMALSMLQGKNIDASVLRAFLTALYLPDDTREMDAIEIDPNRFASEILGSTRSLSEIFQSLAKNGLLTYQNFYVLRSIINHFADDDTDDDIRIKEKLHEYEQSLAGYFLATKIMDYLNTEVEQSEQPRSEPNTLVGTVKAYVTKMLAKFASKFWSLLVNHQQSLDELSVKVKAKVTEKTLNYVKELRDSLAYQVRLPVTALLFDKIAEGCLEITWLIPFHLTHFTTGRLQESTDFFREQKILRVTIAGRCVYEELPPVQVSTRKEKAKGEK